MEQELQYAYLLEIPVESCRIVTRRPKRRSKAAEARVKERVINRVNKESEQTAANAAKEKKTAEIPLENPVESPALSVRNGAAEPLLQTDVNRLSSDERGERSAAVGAPNVAAPASFQEEREVFEPVGSDQTGALFREERTELSGMQADDEIPSRYGEDPSRYGEDPSRYDEARADAPFPCGNCAHAADCGRAANAAHELQPNAAWELQREDGGRSAEDGRSEEKVLFAETEPQFRSETEGSYNNDPALCDVMQELPLRRSEKRGKKERAAGREKASVPFIAAVTVCAVLALALLANVLFFRFDAVGYFTALAQAPDTRTHADFSLAMPVGGDYQTAEGVLSFSEKGSVYAPATGTVVSVTETANGYAMEIAHSDCFKTVISGADIAFYGVGEKVYRAQPVAYNSADDVTVCFYENSVLLSVLGVEDGVLVLGQGV